MSESKFDPLLGRIRESDIQNIAPPGVSTGESSGSSSEVINYIPQYDSDPASPQAQDAWVLRTVSGGAGGGKLQLLFGLGFPVTTTGAQTSTYQLSYRTIEGTTKRVTLS